MFRTAMAAAALALTASAAGAESAPAAAPTPAEPAKAKKICRDTPPRTGSRLPGKRVCRTAEEWREFDRTTLDYDRMDPGTPVRSQAVTPPGDN